MTPLHLKRIGKGVVTGHCFEAGVIVLQESPFQTGFYQRNRPKRSAKGSTPRCVFASSRYAVA